MPVMPKRMAFLSVGAHNRSLISREKVMKTHPVTGDMLVAVPPVFVHFPGDRPLYIDEENVRYTGFRTMREFFAWVNTLGEVEKGEIIYSAVLGAPAGGGKFRPISDMGRFDVDEELRARMMRGEKEEIGGDTEDKAAALLELRRIAGEAVPEPLVAVKVTETVSVPDDVAEELTERILREHSTRR